MPYQPAPQPGSHPVDADTASFVKDVTSPEHIDLGLGRAAHSAAGGGSRSNASSGGAMQPAGAQPLTYAWVQVLWRWLQPHAKYRLNLFMGLPIVPVAGAKLAALQPLASSTVIAPSADWPPGLQPLLQQLGCEVLDSHPERFALPPLPDYAHAASGLGMLGALGAALRLPAGGAALNRSSQPDAGRLAGCSAADKRLLRRYLLQQRWFAAALQTPGAAEMQAAALGLLRQLPIFESAAATQADYGVEGPSVGSVARAAAVPNAEDGATPVAGASVAADVADAAVFVSVAGERYLAPADILPAVLDHRFIQADDNGAKVVLTDLLGVLALSSAAVYRRFVLPHLDAFPAATRDAAMQRLLESLPALLQQDGELAPLLRDARFVPNCKGELKVRIRRVYPG